MRRDAYDLSAPPYRVGPGPYRHRYRHRDRLSLKTLNHKYLPSYIRSSFLRHSFIIPLRPSTMGRLGFGGDGTRPIAQRHGIAPGGAGGGTVGAECTHSSGLVPFLSGTRFEKMAHSNHFERPPRPPSSFPCAPATVVAVQYAVSCIGTAVDDKWWIDTTSGSHCHWSGPGRSSRPGPERPGVGG